MQQLEKALLFTLELAVERALRRAGVTDDVGDGGGAVSALGYRGREAVEQPASKRIDIDGSAEAASSATVLATSPPSDGSPGSALASAWYHRVPYRNTPLVRRSTRSMLGVHSDEHLDTQAAPAPPAIKLPPTPRIPKALQGAAFSISRRWIVRQMARRYGDVFMLNVPVYGPIVVVANPQLAKQIFTTSPEVLGNIKPNLSRLLGSGSVSRWTATSTDSGAGCWRRLFTARASRTTRPSSKKKRCARSPAGPRGRHSRRCRRPCASRSTPSCVRSSGPKARAR